MTFVSAFVSLVQTLQRENNSLQQLTGYGISAIRRMSGLFRRQAMPDARMATAEALAQELDLDMTPEFLVAIDKFIAQLWMRGFKIVPVTNDEQ